MQQSLDGEMTNQSGQSTTQEVLIEIQRAIEQIRFGSVEITVHEGRVTQIERREKVRLAADKPKQN